MTVTYADVDVFLEHHGVKGMHWGVVNEDPLVGRRPPGMIVSTQPRTPGVVQAPSARPAPVAPTKSKSSEPLPDTLENNQKKIFGLTKKQAVVGASIIVGVGVAAVLMSKYGTMPQSSMKKGLNESTIARGKGSFEYMMRTHKNQEEFVMPKGSTFARISSLAETSMRDATYVNAKEKDIAKYTNDLGSFGGYRVNIKALSDIKVPSFKTRIDTMAELVDKPHSDLFGEAKTLRNYLISEQTTENAKKYVQKAPADEIAKYQYGRMVGGHWEQGLGKKFIDSLASKGYNAMFDDADSTNGLSESAMVLINKKAFQITGAQKLDWQNIAEAQKLYEKLLGS